MIDMLENYHYRLLFYFFQLRQTVLEKKKTIKYDKYIADLKIDKNDEKFLLNNNQNL